MYLVEKFSAFKLPAPRLHVGWLCFYDHASPAHLLSVMHSCHCELLIGAHFTVTNDQSVST